MTPRSNARCWATAIALCGATTAGATETLTLLSVPLQWATQYACTVTNVSNQPLQVLRVQIVQDGVVYWDGGNACTGTLGAGGQCVHRTAASVTEPRQPYCRVQYSGVAGALVASFMGDFALTVNVASGHGAVAAVPLQPVKTVTLAPAN